jgi:hypothetical protein
MTRPASVCSPCRRVMRRWTSSWWSRRSAKPGRESGGVDGRSRRGVGRNEQGERRLRQLQNDYLQSGDIRKVPGVRREQPEVMLNRLRREPQVVDANMWVSSGLSKLGGQDPERLSRFDGDSQLRFSTKTTKHGGGSLLLRTGSHQRHAEPDFGEVDRREIYGFLPSDGVNIGRSERSAFNRDP